MWPYSVRIELHVVLLLFFVNLSCVLILYCAPLLTQGLAAKFLRAARGRAAWAGPPTPSSSCSGRASTSGSSWTFLRPYGVHGDRVEDGGRPFRPLLVSLRRRRPLMFVAVDPGVPWKDFAHECNRIETAEMLLAHCQLLTGRLLRTRQGRVPLLDEQGNVLSRAGAHERAVSRRTGRKAESGSPDQRLPAPVRPKHPDRVLHEVREGARAWPAPLPVRGRQSDRAPGCTLNLSFFQFNCFDHFQPLNWNQ